MGVARLFDVQPDNIISTDKTLDLRTELRKLT